MTTVRRERVWPWFAIYGLTGAVALGFEQLFFRVIDAEMRSNSYSFAHVLMLYLLLFGVGSALGARLLRRGRRPSPMVPLDAVLGRYHRPARHHRPRAGTAAVGLSRRKDCAAISPVRATTAGSAPSTRSSEWSKVIGVYGVIPLGLMGAPVLLMGMSFPFVQALVSDRVDSLGRRTGALLFVNIAGNVAGTLLTGFVLIDVLGTAGTYRLLTLALGVAGIAAASLDRAGRRRVARDRRRRRRACRCRRALAVQPPPLGVPPRRRRRRDPPRRRPRVRGHASGSSTGTPSCTSTRRFRTGIRSTISTC